MNAKQFGEGYKSLLDDLINVTKDVWELLQILLFAITVIAMIPFIPFIILGKFIYDKVKGEK